MALKWAHMLESCLKNEKNKEPIQLYPHTNYRMNILFCA